MGGYSISIQRAMSKMVGPYRILWLAATILTLGTEYCGSETPILKCFASASPTSELDQYSSNTAGNPSPYYSFVESSMPTGQLQDAKCNVEEIEHANDSQLYSILHDLVQTTFFRNFVVDLDHGCPLLAKNAHPPIERPSPTTPATQSSSTTNSAAAVSQLSSTAFLPLDSSDHDSGTCGGGLPDFFPSENNGKQACDIELADEQEAILETFQGTPEPKSQTESNTETGAAVTLTKSDPAQPAQDSFECETSHELEDEPLCEIQESDFQDTYMSELALTPLKDFLTSALKAIWERVGWESESQRKTFAWSTPSDPVVGANKGDVPALPDEECDDDVDSFWMDMCSQIKLGEAKKVVNLVLNPERNTGYNGTHIWKAIYDENCVQLDGNASSPMCYEERVLYRLLSGMHASTSISIAKNYYPPSKRKGRTDWQPNPQYFMDKFHDHPDYIRNLHFSYVVLLRALRKAKPLLYNFDLSTGDIVQDESALLLLRRLLDTHILKSCSSVFEAFDESLMFRDASTNHHKGVSLQANFKGVFHNISNILDCVQCQQCKLHGKMTMLGYGTALKILFLPPSKLTSSSLTRNEVVAFVNTVAKLSESLKDVRTLTHLYWTINSASGYNVNAIEGMSGPTTVTSEPTLDSQVDEALMIISRLNRDGQITDEREEQLVEMALGGHAGLLALVKHYASDLSKFLLFSQSLPSLAKHESDLSVKTSKKLEPDAIVVGAGLAGLAATLNILDRGGSVILIEKEHSLGGNSAKASSGINACCLSGEEQYHDTLESFFNDTVKSAGTAAQYQLIQTLTKNSAQAVEWLKTRANVDLSLLAQLGGHSHKRTHRPSNGMVGAEIIYNMQREVKKYLKLGKIQLLLDTRVTKLIFDGDKVVGVEAQSYNTDGIASNTLTAPNVILATGGFASDRSHGSYLHQYRPELMKMPATAGEFSTGDGIRLALELGAGVVDMEKVQIHPTGWVDPSDPQNPTKILAAELMRGVGGILINSDGQRFCNELGTRSYVADKMLQHNAHYKETGQWDASSESPILYLVLSSSAAADGKKHVDLYTHKGLLTKLHGLDALAEWMQVDRNILRITMEQYITDAKFAKDQWGKTEFRGVPSEDLDGEVFYAGKVTPVLHYCMGGLTIDSEGNVLRQLNGKPIPGLHAAGEVSGGVHGVNRLGGNSLLECTVFGTIVGQKIPIQSRENDITYALQADKPTRTSKMNTISHEELAKHNTPQDCWVALHGKVYDLTEFAEEHPPGAQSIYDLAGMDGTAAFSAVHNAGMLDDFQDVELGSLSHN